MSSPVKDLILIKNQASKEKDANVGDCSEDYDDLESS